MRSTAGTTESNQRQKGVCVSKLEGKVAWITGAASGMGEATAELFAAEGAHVAVVDIQTERGEALVARIEKAGGHAKFHECDVTKGDQVRTSLDQTVSDFGDLQIMVNCAGVAHVAPLHEYPEEEWDLLMGVNLKVDVATIQIETSQRFQRRIQLFN